MRSEMLTTEKVLEVFTDELAARKGKITDTFNDGRRLFCRGIFPQLENVRPGDALNGGVAIKATDEQICVYPYTFRVLCQNGAIRAQSVGSICIEGLDQLQPYPTLMHIREAIDACSAPEVFADTMTRMRSVASTQIDMMLNFAAYFSTHPCKAAAEMMSKILDRFFEEKDQTQFGLANAITSVARDTSDPEKRWDLEEFGGGLLIAIAPKLPRDSARAKRNRAAALSIA